jgi:hypothetical protein
MTFLFQEYVEASPGQFAPLRIHCQSGSLQMDLRFQIVDGRLWLFDRKAGEDVAVPAFVDHIRINGNEPARRQQSDSTDPPSGVRWAQFINRNSIREGDRLTPALIASEEPWQSSFWETLNRCALELDGEGTRVLRVSLRSWPTLGIARYWTLTQLNAEGAIPLLCAETPSPDPASQVAVVPLKFDESLPVPRLPDTALESVNSIGGSASETTRIFRLTASRDPNGDMRLLPEILSTRWYTDQSVRMSSVLLGDDGTPLSGGFTDQSFRTYAEPVVSKEGAITLRGLHQASGAFILAGCRAVVTGMPMGSRWAMLANEDPLFEARTLLNSRFPAVRELGLQQLYQEQWPNASELFAVDSRGDRDIVEGLAPYINTLNGVLTGKNGDNTPTALATACRLAGFSQEETFIAPLRELLHHDSSDVRDSAAIGLGLLLQDDGILRLRELASQRPPDADPASHPYATFRAEEIQWALARLGN